MTEPPAAMFPFRKFQKEVVSFGMTRWGPRARTGLWDYLLGILDPESPCQWLSQGPTACDNAPFLRSEKPLSHARTLSPLPVSPPGPPFLWHGHPVPGQNPAGCQWLALAGPVVPLQQPVILGVGDAAPRSALTTGSPEEGWILGWEN